MIGMFDEMDNHYGGGGVRTSIVHYLTTELIPMLQQRGVAPAPLRELFAAAARLAAMAGWSSYDAGEYGLAQRYMTQGLRLCAEGRDRVLGGQILAGLSHLATSLGRPDEGVCLARAGLATAKGAGSPLGLMRLYAMTARGHAALGRARETSEALRAAERQLAASRGSAEESPWVRFLDHHYLEAESALCFRDLGWAAQAEDTAAQSVRAHADRRRRQAISRSVLATAHLQQHRLDEALEHGDGGTRRAERRPQRTLDPGPAGLPRPARPAPRGAGWCRSSNAGRAPSWEQWPSRHPRHYAYATGQPPHPLARQAPGAVVFDNSTGAPEGAPMTTPPRSCPPHILDTAGHPRLRGPSRTNRTDDAAATTGLHGEAPLISLSRPSLFQVVVPAHPSCAARYGARSPRTSPSGT